MSLFIRTAKLSDLESLAQLHLKAAGEALSEPAFRSRLEFWQHLLGGGARRTQVWVAIAPSRHPDGTPIGFIVAGGARLLAHRFTSEITALYISPEFQRQGVGTELLNTALGALNPEGKAHSIMAWICPGSPGAQFLEKRGWKMDPASQRTRNGIQEIAASL